MSLLRQRDNLNYNNDDNESVMTTESNTSIDRIILENVNSSSEFDISSVVSEGTTVIEKELSTSKLQSNKQEMILNTFNASAPRSQGVDFIIGFGGDGLLMHCNTLFENYSIPPAMCFDFGSMGFLAPFNHETFESDVS